MASLAFSSPGCFLSQSSFQTVSNSKSEPSFPSGKAMFAARKHDNTRASTVTNISSPQRPVVAPLQENENPSNQNHVAWTSVKQERWEGELAVQGEIPLWLVRCKFYRVFVDRNHIWSPFFFFSLFSPHTYQLLGRCQQPYHCLQLNNMIN